MNSIEAFLAAQSSLSGGEAGLAILLVVCAVAFAVFAGWVPESHGWSREDD